MSGTEVYLDNAATMQPWPEVVDAVAHYMREGFGNASAQHARGKQAHEALERSRETIADALGVDTDELFFTSGGTESNNLAIVGSCRAQYAINGTRDRIIASAVEHPSVTKSVRGMKREGWPVEYVNALNGEFDFTSLEEKLTSGDKTGLITCMSVQNEVGFKLPIAEVVAMRDKLSPEARVHTDGVQAFGKIDFRPKELGVDLASMSAHKIGGPQGIGAIYVKRGVKMFTNAFGGGQEQGLRSGTEALPLIVGFAEAVRITMTAREEAERHVQRLKDQLLAGVLEIAPDTRINSRDDGSPFVTSFSIPGMDNNPVLEHLSEQSIYVSKASACKTLHPNIPKEDWVGKHPMSLLLTGVPKKLTESTLRISFSARSTAKEVDTFLKELAVAIKTA